MIITISGTPGSGKSSIAEEIAKTLGYMRIYVGGIRRQIAKERGITLEELNEQSLTDPSSDYEADEIMRKLVYSQDNLVVEGLVAAFLFKKWGIEKDAVHVFIKCAPKVAGERIFKQKQKEGTEGRNEHETKTLKQQIEDVKTRMKTDTTRYKKYYDSDHLQESWYDIIIDTSKLNKEEALAKTHQEIKSFAKDKFGIEVD